jgi:predicted RNase H-related nuclease YkuK (DUF458 family)
MKITKMTTEQLLNHQERVKESYIFKKNNKYVIKLGTETFSYSDKTQALNALQDYEWLGVLPKSQKTYKNNKNNKSTTRRKKRRYRRY